MSTGPDVIVVGAGAAGLWAAAVCARAGRRTLVLEKTPRAGTKVARTAIKAAKPDRLTAMLSPNVPSQSSHPAPNPSATDRTLTQAQRRSVSMPSPSAVSRAK